MFKDVLMFALKKGFPDDSILRIGILNETNEMIPQYMDTWQETAFKSTNVAPSTYDDSFWLEHNGTTLDIAIGTLRWLGMMIGYPHPSNKDKYKGIIDGGRR